MFATNNRNVTISCVHRFLYNWPQCFWRFHQGHAHESASKLSKEKRKELCSLLGWKWEKLSDAQGRNENDVLSVGEPTEAKCVAILAEGGGFCWFSSIYYLPVGGKRGKGLRDYDGIGKVLRLLNCVDKKKNTSVLRTLRKKVGEAMQTCEFEQFCIERLGYSTNPWELQWTIDHNTSVSEPWVGIKPYLLQRTTKMVFSKTFVCFRCWRQPIF